MITSIQSDIDALLLQLEDQNTNAYRAGVLIPLNILIAVLSFIGLIIIIAPPFIFDLNIIIVSLSLGINLLIIYLVNHNRAEVASYIFCFWVNLGILYFIYANLFIELDQRSSAIFSCILALCVLLSGMLLGKLWGIIFAIVNSLVLIGIYYFSYLIPPLLDDNLIDSTLVDTFPVIVFLMMVATISYLYQRALARKDERLRLARDRILSDELLRRDMAVAREMQQRLYPPPPLIDSQITIAALSEPARETSGDFYDYIELGDGLLGIVVADVTGKSLAAAMVMAMARSAIRSEARRYSSPTDVLHHANQTLCADRSVDQFLTCFYGVLDTKRLELRFANAGHPYPILRRNDTLSELINNGLPLGARSDAHYEDQVIELRPGDQLILLSDGTFEERNEQREIFGFDRLHATINMVKGDDPHRMVNTIKAAVDQFRGSREQSDDLTMVAIQFQAQAAAVGEALFIASPTATTA